MSILNKDKITFDPTALDKGDNIGSYTRDGYGNQISSTFFNEAQGLDINVTSDVEKSPLKTLIDREGNITFIGKAVPNSLTSDPVWRIFRIVKEPSGDETTELAGTGDYDQIWDNRESLFSSVTENSFFEKQYEKLFPLLTNANWMNLGNFNRIHPTFDGYTATLDYYEDNAIIGRANVSFVNDLDWNFSLERYINQPNGDILLDDDGTPLNLD